MQQLEQARDEAVEPQIIDRFDGDHRWLSNFDDSMPFVVQGVLAPTGEHHYQALKAATPEDAAKVYACATPGQAKRMGRVIQIRPDWNTDVCVRAMLLVTQAKYAVSYYRERLLATGDAKLVEGNTWHDNRWGDCSCANCTNKPGMNLLGRILVNERDRIRILQSI